MRVLRYLLCILLALGGPAYGQSVTPTFPVGQLITATATGVALTSTVAKTITSVTLTPGDWDCQGWAQFLSAAGGNPTFQALATSTVTNNVGGVYDVVNSPAATANLLYTLNAHTTDYPETANTTIFLVAQANFVTTTVTVNNAVLNCRRWR